MTMIRDAKFWDGAARKYAAGPIKDPAGFEKTLSRVSDFLKPEDDVLELGCGTGTAALRLAPTVARYLATDISPEMISIARKKGDSQPLPHLEFETAIVDTLASRQEHYDAVLGFNYIHLVEDIDHTLTVVCSMLEPGGCFITKTPCIGEMTPLIRIVIPILRAFGKAPLHVHPITASQLQQMISKAGFEIVVSEYHGTRGKDVRPFIVARKL